MRHFIQDKKKRSVTDLVSIVKYKNKEVYDTLHKFKETIYRFFGIFNGIKKESMILCCM